MIRLHHTRYHLLVSASLAALLTVTADAAPTLYKWVEADGSITFSPTPPAGGVPYEQVTSNAGADNESGFIENGSVPARNVSPSFPTLESTSTASSDTSPVVVPDLGNDDAANRARASELGIRASEPARVGTVAPARLSYAPSGNLADPDSGLTASAIQGGRVAASRPGQAVDARTNSATLSPEANALVNKRARCEQLKMRVVSLERRLRQHLSPGDMDNTVVHMARYQQSYDQHCRF